MNSGNNMKEKGDSMKYLKYSLGIFAFAITLSTLGVNADTVNIVNVKIPILSRAYTNAQIKETNSTQYIKKTSCTDDLTGDGRVIIAAVKNYSHLNTQYENSTPVEASPNTNVAMPKSNKSGNVTLFLQSKKNLPTTATFNGIWTID